ncbi:MAG TPA: hypothetical protein VGE07_02365, partial [Herpetosiphonaceae bacterium]
ICGSLVAIGGIAVRYGDDERAVRLFAVVESALEEIERTLDTADQPLYAEESALARTRMDHAAWMKARDAGQAMKLDAAVEYALETAYQGEPPPLAEQEPPGEPLDAAAPAGQAG